MFSNASLFYCNLSDDYYPVTNYRYILGYPACLFNLLTTVN